MKAVVLTRYGGPEVLQITDAADPLPRAGEVRVRIRLIGINFAEILSRRGLYGWAPRLPYIPGMEAFGEVDMLGEGVTALRVGDPVIVGTKFGTYAELICIPAERAIRPPRGFTPEQSAAFAVNYLTAWIGLMEMARLRASDTVLVTSAAGGVGSAAVQIAHKFGARVFGASSRGKEHSVRGLGADRAFAYEDFDSVSTKFDVVLEMVGGSVYKHARSKLAPMGRLVIAGASDAFPITRNPFARLASMRNLPFPSIFDMLRHSYGIMCFHVGWLLEQSALQTPLQNLVQFTEEQGIKPAIAREFAFDRIGDAHRMLESRSNIGKVLVRM